MSKINDPADFGHQKKYPLAAILYRWNEFFDFINEKTKQYEKLHAFDLRLLHYDCNGISVL